VYRFLAYLALLTSLAMGAAWYSLRPPTFSSAPRTPTAVTSAPRTWLTHLYSQNPREADEAAREVSRMGADALPVIRTTLQNPDATRDERKAALKACSVLGETAAPVVADVAAELRTPDLTAEAALALSFMGPDAFGPLRDALADNDPAVRREALRSIGKLRFRAPLDSRTPLALLHAGVKDADPGVRAVAVTYLGILHDDPGTSLPPLIAALDDGDFTVRRAAATALGSFGSEAWPAVPALRKAAGDAVEDVAREAGLAIVKIQAGSKSPKSDR
jgi:HEAT repeat protein